MKVLIICNDFPPLNSIGARRPYSWWKYLKLYGIEPVVITKYWPGRSDTLDDLMRQIEATGPKVATIEQDEHGIIIRGQNKLALYEKLLLHKKGIPWIIIRKFITMTWRLLAFLFPRFDKHWNLYQQAKLFIANNHVDAVITTGEPFILNKYGYLIKKQFKVKWIADYRDGWFLHHTARFSRNPIVRLIRRWEKIFEMKYVSKADAITAAFPILAEELKVLFNKPVHLIINGYEEIFEKSKESKAGLPLSFTFGGNVITGQTFDLFLEAVYQLKQEGLISKGDILIKFIGGGFNPNQKNLLSPYPSLLSDCLVMTPRVPISEARQMCSEADYLLLFLMPNYKNIPSKLFEYLSLQRPILVIPNDLDVVEEIVKDTQAGIFCSDIPSIKDLILKQVSFKKTGNSIPPTNISTDSIFKYSREYQTKLLAEIIKSISA